MADVTIDSVVEDMEVTGGEKIPVSDGGIPKAVTTDSLKNFVLKRIAALASADKVDTASDGVYLLKGGELKPVSAAVLAAAVMDYAFALAPVQTITGNETVSIKDATVKKTLSLDMLKSWLTEGSVTAEELKAVADSVADKVDKEEGKGLSEENFSAADKAKLDSLVSNAQPDWEQTDDTDPSYIRNKPTIPEELVVDMIMDPTSSNPISNSAVAAAIRSSEGVSSLSFGGIIKKPSAEGRVVLEFSNSSMNPPPTGEEIYAYPEGFIWYCTGGDSKGFYIKVNSYPERWVEVPSLSALYRAMDLKIESNSYGLAKINDPERGWPITTPPKQENYWFKFGYDNEYHYRLAKWMNGRWEVLYSTPDDIVRIFSDKKEFNDFMGLNDFSGMIRLALCPGDDGQLKLVVTPSRDPNSWRYIDLTPWNAQTS